MTLTIEQATERGITFRWSDDWEVGSHREFFGPGSAYENSEPDTCEQCDVLDADGELLASLGCIDDADEDYRRTVEAELLSELPEFDTYATDQIDRVIADERAGLDRKSLPAEDEVYQLQISPNHAFQPTKHMNISPAELAGIRTILARRTL